MQTTRPVHSCNMCMLQFGPGDEYAKKKECCKKYKHGKRCKKCPKANK